MDNIHLLFQDNDVEEAVSTIFFEDTSSSDEDFLLVKKLLVSKASGTTAQVNLQVCLKNTEDCSDEEFIKTFRMNRRKVIQLIRAYQETELSENLIEGSNAKILNIDKERRILIFLWFAGHRRIKHRDICNVFNINSGTLFRLILNVSQFFISLEDIALKWPDSLTQTLSKIAYAKKGFPDVIGCLGTTVIPITRPLEHYVSCWNNIEGNFHFVLQAVCNENNEFMDIYVANAGVTEPNVVFKDSPLFKRISENLDSGVLLASLNANYPLTKCMITPHISENWSITPEQSIFNEKLVKCCSDIDHTFDLLKRRFPQLYNVNLKDPTRIINFIKACCILHNIADEADHIYFDGAIDEELE